MDHPFFEDIDWNDVVNKRYAYDKQFLKIDMSISNFVLDGEPNIDIDFHEEALLSTKQVVQQQ